MMKERKKEKERKKRRMVGKERKERNQSGEKSGQEYIRLRQMVFTFYSPYVL